MEYKSIDTQYTTTKTSMWFICQKMDRQTGFEEFEEKTLYSEVIESMNAVYIYLIREQESL